VFENSFDMIIEFVSEMRELGIRPEHGVLRLWARR